GDKERVERIERGETVKGGLAKPLTRKEAEAIMMQAGMTRADNPSERADGPASEGAARDDSGRGHAAEAPCRERCDQRGVARVSAPRRLAAFPSPWTGTRRGEGCESALEPSEASLGGARATRTIGRRRACHGDGVEPGLQARASSASPGSASPRSAHGISPPATIRFAR